MRRAQCAEARADWAIPWPCLYESFSLATHPRIYNPPTSAARALGQIDAWLESPSLVLLIEGERHWPRLRELVSTVRIAGPVMHGARIGALWLQHGVRELLSADRDAGGRYGHAKIGNTFWLRPWVRDSWWDFDEVPVADSEERRGSASMIRRARTPTTPPCRPVARREPQPVAMPHACGAAR